MPIIGAGAVLGGIIAYGIGAGALVAGSALFSMVMSGVMMGASVGQFLTGIMNRPKFGNDLNSPAYRFGPLGNTVSNELPLPVGYGKVRIAGNIIWRTGEGTKELKMFVALCEGEINSVSNIRINDIPIGDLPGCSYTVYYGTATQNVDARAGGNVKGLRYTAYIALTLQVSEKLMSVSSITCEVEALKISTWYSVDEEWSVPKSFSRNPSACVRDFLKSPRYGCAKTRINGGSFGSVAEYCDELIKVMEGKADNGTTTTLVDSDRDETDDYWNGRTLKIVEGTNQGESRQISNFEKDTNTITVSAPFTNPIDSTSVYEIQEKRYELDYVIDSKRPAIDILNEMLASFGGFLVNSGNEIHLRIEKEETAFQSFDMTDILENSFSYTPGKKDDVPNQIKIQYILPSEKYSKVPAMARDRIDQDERFANGMDPVVEREISLLPISRTTQALRMANMALSIAQLCGTFCSFRIGIVALNSEPGDVIKVSHTLPMWGYTGESPNEEADPDNAKPFRILQIREHENDEMELLCREYNASIYDDSYGSTIQIPDYGSPANPYAASDNVSNVTCEEIGWRQKDGTHVANIDVNWIEPTDKQYIKGYRIEWSEEANPYVQVGWADRGATSFRLSNAKVGSSYIIRIRTLSINNVFSSGATSSPITPIGKDALPPDVTIFVINQFRNSIVFSWNDVRDNDNPDIRGYEIREGASWINGEVIATNLPGTSYPYQNIKMGTCTYWIKAIDNSRNRSSNAKSAQVTIEKIPFQNVIETRDEHTAWTGDKVDVSKVNDHLELDAGKLTGTYTTLEWDIGKVVTARISINYVVNNNMSYAWDTDGNLRFNTYGNLRWGGFDLPGAASFKIAYKETAGGGYSAWVPLQFADYKFRYLKIRATLGREDTNIDLEFTQMTINVDVPDVDDWGTGVSVIVGGTNVNFNKVFYEVPQVSITIRTSDGTLRTHEVSAVSTTAFTVKLRDKNEAEIAGIVDWHAHGW